jgi:hypothetical protein
MANDQAMQLHKEKQLTRTLHQSNAQLKEKIVRQNNLLTEEKHRANTAIAELTKQRDAHECQGMVWCKRRRVSRRKLIQSRHNCMI